MCHVLYIKAIPCQNLLLSAVSSSFLICKCINDLLLHSSMQDLQLELEEQNQTVDELNASLKDEISKKKKALSDLKALDEDKREVYTTS